MTDSDVTMLANENFEYILNVIQNSCLNYSIQFSPFSATISLRKTLIKDKNGSHIIPQKLDLRGQHVALGNQLKNLRMEHEEVLSAYESANKIITHLRQMVKERDTIIEDLTVENKEAKMIADTLGNELSKSKAIYQEEKSNILEEHFKDVAKWKRDIYYVVHKHSDLVHRYINLVDKDEFPAVNLPVADLTPRVNPITHPYSTTMFKEKTLDDYRLCPLETSDCSPMVMCKEEGELTISRADLPFPSSLVSHWLTCIDYPCCSALSYMPSLISHYVRPLDPADVILSKTNLWEKLEMRYQEERKNSCKQS